MTPRKLLRVLGLAGAILVSSCARTEVRRVVVALPIPQNQMDWDRCVGVPVTGSAYSVTLDAFALVAQDGGIVAGTSPCERCFGANPAGCRRVSGSSCAGAASGSSADLRSAFALLETGLGGASQGLCVRGVVRLGACGSVSSRVLACMLNGAPQNLNVNTESISLDQAQCSAIDERCASVAMQCGSVRQSLRDGPLRDQLDALCGEASRSICARITAEECALP